MNERFLFLVNALPHKQMRTGTQPPLGLCVSGVLPRVSPERATLGCVTKSLWDSSFRA